MSNEIAPALEKSPSPSPLEPPAEDRRIRWLELFLVLVVAFGSSLENSLYLLTNGRAGMSVPATEDARWIGGIVRELIGLLLLGYVLWRRKLRFKDLGLTWSKGTLPNGFGVAAVACASYLAGSFVTHRFFVSFLPFLHGGVTARALFSSSSVMIVPFFLLSPIFEELIVRAYLMTEVQALTGSWTLATFLSVAIQFSYHLYYGWEGALAVSFLFIVFSVYYARTRNATPIIIAHELFDLWGLATLI